MSFDFQDKTTEEVVQTILALDTSSQVDAVFKKLEKLDASVSLSVAEILEKKLLEQVVNNEKEILKESKPIFPEKSASEVLEMSRTLKKQMEDAYKDVPLAGLGSDSDDGFEQWGEDMATPATPEEIEKSAATGQALCFVFNKIAAIKGETAAPATKAIVAEIRKLSAADRKDGDLVTIAMLKGYEKAAKAGPKA
jgi:hypothetical protein